MKNFCKSGNILKQLFWGILGTLALLLPSCGNMGLGAAVDTEKPVALIEDSFTPSYVVKGEFTVSGTCYDDLTVTDVEVKLKNLDTDTETVYTVKNSGEVKLTRNKNANGDSIIDEKLNKRIDKWSVTLNTPDSDGNYPLSDGKYTISVTAMDEANNDPADLVAAERSFVIDNTPPLLILSRPGLSDTYGRTLNISGRAAEDNDVKTMEIMVYDENPEGKNIEPVYVITKKNIAPSIDIDAAVLGNEDTDPVTGEVLDIYKKIYGFDQDVDVSALKTEDLLSKNLWCRVYVTDGAKAYPSNESENGNRTSVFFIDSDISTFKEDYNLTVSDMYHVINGTKSFDDVKKWFENKYIEEKDRVSTFSLNPENSPKFILQGGYNAVSDFNSISQLTPANNDLVLIKVLAGKDETPLVKDSISVSAYEVEPDSESSRGWKKKEGAESLVLLKAAADCITQEEKDDRESLFEGSSVAYSVAFKVSTGKGLTIGSSYILEVSGYDQNEKTGKTEEINNAGAYYGFRLTEKGSAPKLELNKPESTDAVKYVYDSTTYINKAFFEKAVISGKATHTESYPDKVVFDVNSTLTSSPYSFTKELVTADLDSEGNFEVSLRDLITGGITSGYGEFDVKIVAVKLGEEEGKVFESTKISLTVIYDNNEPKISISSVSPVVVTTDSAAGGTEKNNVNGKVTITVSVADDDTAVVTDDDGYLDYYYILESGSRKNGKFTKTIVIDTCDVTDKVKDKADLTLGIIAYDKAGNKAEKILYCDEENEIKYFVDQDTDKPVITLEGLKNGVVNPTKTLNCEIQGTRLNGNITDDDGLSEIIIECTDENNHSAANYPVSLTVGSGLSENQLSYSFAQELPSEKGNYHLVVKAKDNNSPAVESNIFDTWVKLKGKAPVLGEPVFDREYISVTGTGKKELVISGIVEGDHESDTNCLRVQVSKDKVNWKDVWTTAGKDYTSYNEAEWSYTFNENGTDSLGVIGSGDGVYKLYVRAFDANDTVSSEKEVSYEIDNVKPSVQSVSISEGKFINDSSVQLTVGTSDTKRVDAYYYQLVKDGETAPAVTSYKDLTVEKGWIQAGDSVILTFKEKDSSSAEGYEEGKWKLYVYAIDGACNVSDRKEVSFTADITNPEVSFDSVVTGKKYIKEPIVLSGTVHDDNADKVFVKSGTENSKEYTVNADGTWSTVTDFYPLSTDTSNGTKTFEVYAVDKAGNKSETVIHTVTFDNVPPTPNLSVSTLLDFNGKTNVVNQDITISGTASDNDKVTETKLCIKQGETVVQDWFNVTDSSLPEGFSNTAAVNSAVKFAVTYDTTRLSDGDYSVGVISSDRAGNEKAEFVAIYVNQNSDKPVLSLEDTTDSSITDKTGVNKNGNGKNLFSNKSDAGRQIKFSAKDDDGNPVTKIWYKPVNQASYAAEPSQTFTTTSFSATLPETEDFYNVKVQVEDQNGLAGTGYEFIVGVSAGSPEVKINGSEKTYVRSTAVSQTPVTIIVDYKLGEELIRTVEKAGTSETDITDNSEVLAAPAPTGDEQSYTDTLKVYCADGKTSKVTVTYSAKNKFNQQGEASYTFLIDNYKPVITSADDVKVNSHKYEDGKWNNSKDYTFELSWKDIEGDAKDVEDSAGYTHSSEISTINYWVTKTGTTPNVATDQARGSYSPDVVKAGNKNTVYSINKVITGFEEGKTSIWFEAVDNAGNHSELKELKIQTDTTAPVLSVDQTDTVYVQDIENFKITGTVTDPGYVGYKNPDNQGEGVNTWHAIRVLQNTGKVANYHGPEDGNYIDYKKAEDSAAPSYVRTTDKDGNEISYAVDQNYQFVNEVGIIAHTINYGDAFEVILDKNYFTGDAPYYITVIASDLRENRAYANFILDVDTEAPTVTINGPVGRTASNALGSSENPVTVFGTAADAKSQVKAVYWMIKEASVAAPAKDASGWNEIITTGAWSKTLGAAEPRGKRKLYVYSKDSADNTSAIASAEYHIDYADPVITVKVDDAENTSASEIVKTDSQFTFEATAKDEYNGETDTGIDSFVIKQNGTEVTGKQTVTVDGVYEYEVTATDKVGKTVTTSRTIRLDKTPPVVEVSSPDFGTTAAPKWQSTKNITVKGTAADVTSNVNKVYWTRKTETDAPAPASKTLALVESNWTTGDKWTALPGISNWEFALSELPEQKDGIIRIAAADSCGNFEVITKPLYVDLADPTLVVKVDDVTTTNNQTANVTSINGNVVFTIEDTFLDTTPYTVSITKPDGNALAADGYSLTAKADNTDTSKTFTLAIINPAQGVYTVSITAKDQAGKTKTSAVKLNHDTEAPTATFANLADEQWISSKNFTVKGSTTDATKVKAVYYTLLDAEAAPKPENNAQALNSAFWSADKWSPVTGSAAAGNAELTDLADGKGTTTLRIITVDILGNWKEYDKSLWIDHTKPTVEIYKEAAFSNKITTAVETNAAYTFYIKATDETSGIKEVSVLNNALTASNGVYSYTSSGDEGSYSYDVKVTDKAGNETVQNVQVVIDKTVPTVDSFSPSLTVLENGTEYVNGTIYLSFTIKDERKLAGTYSYKIVDEDDTEKKASVSGTITGAMSERVTVSIDTTELTNKKKNIVTVTAEDAAGNSQDYTYTLNVDQDTDCPYYEKTGDVTLFGLGVWTIYGKVSDDDGISKIQVKIDEGDLEDKFTATAGEEKTSQSFNYLIDGDNITEGEHTLTVLITDKNGKTNETVHKAEVSFTVDKNAPTIVPYKVNGSNYTEDMFVKASFDVYLQAEDACGIEKVELTEVNGKTTRLATQADVEAGKAVNVGDEISIIEEISIEESGTYSGYYKDSVTETNGSGKSRVYLVTDTNGRTATKEIKIQVDTVPPEVDGNLISYSGGERTATTSQVGDVWFSTDSITIKSNDAVSDDNLDMSVTVTINGTEAYFNLTPEKKDNTKKGKFENKQSVPNGTSVPVVLTFKDEAGNEKTHSVNLKVDNVPPVCGAPSLKKGNDDVTSLNKADITNIATKKVTFALTITDATSGISTVKLYDGTSVVRNAGNTADLAATVSSGTYTFEIPASALTDGNHDFKVIAVDNAGNQIVSAVKSLTVDQTPPNVTYLSPISGAENINGTITLSGTVTEANLLDSFVPGLYIGETKIKDGSYDSSTGTWTISEVDTKGTNFTNKAENNLKVVFTDKSGNSSTDILKLNINQDADIPVITLNTISTDTANTSKINSSTIAGTIEDDDIAPSGSSGQVRKLEVKVVQANNTAAAITGKTADSNGWVDITPAGGSSAWSFDLDSPTDQTYTMSFRVTDWTVPGTIVENSDPQQTVYTPNFTTGETAAPYIKNGNTKVNTAVSFEFDKDPPVIGKLYGSVDGGTESQLSNRDCFGGNQTKVTISILAYDKTYKKNISAAIKIGQADAVSMNPVSGSFKLNDVDCAKFTYDIKLADVPNGRLPVSVTVTDGAKGSSTASVQFTIDKLAPTGLSGITPEPTYEKTNTVTVTGQVMDDNTAGSGVTEIAYYIPPYTVGSAATKNPAGVTDWNSSIPAAGETSKISLSSVMFTLTLDNLTDYVGERANSTLKSDYEDYETGPDTGVYDIPVWFRLTDACGNVGYYTDYSVRYNPNADKPRISVTKLTEKDPVTHTLKTTGKDLTYYILGGNIVIRGTAEDDEGIEAVYVQYDINGDGDFNETDKTWLTNNGFTVETIPATGTPGDWGIKATGKGQWSVRFDARKFSSTDLEKIQVIETDGEYDGGTMNVRFRAVDLATLPSGVANTQYASAWSDIQHISINANSPQFDPDVYVVQYTSNTYETEVAGSKKAYTSGMYISGSNWRVEGSVEDPDGTVDDIVVTGTNSGTLTSKSAWFSLPAEGTGKLRYFKIPVTNATGGAVTKFSIGITASDNDDDTGELSVDVNVDNTAPAFEKNGDALKIYKDGYGGRNELLNTTVKLQNSNGATTIAGSVMDAQSGFEKMFVFAKRSKSDGTDPRIYNLMEEYGADRTANRTDLGVANGGITVSIDTTTGSITKGLPVFTATVTKDSSDNTKFTYAAGKTNKNLRAGGYVVINNRFYKIASKDTDGVFTLTEAVEGSYTSAKFIYAMCIDISSESTGDADGDGMIESFRQSGSNFIWSMEFDSSHIPDGPIDLNFVVYDAAGNHASESLETRVSNNAPRITHVRLGTDLNQNGSIQDTDDYSEYTDFYAYKNSYGDADLTTGKDVWNLNPADETESVGRAWTIKKDLYVIPEFVGGTGPFYWVFSKAEGADQGITAAASGVDTTNKKINNKGTIALNETALGTNGEDGINTYRFSFWDSTEESTPGTDTGWCILNVNLKQDLTDSTRPVPYVHPFFWEKTGAETATKKYNSLQWNGKTPLGHIELEADLTDAIKKATNGTKALGADPKVSGQIIIRGTAYDETKLTAVKVEFDGIISDGDCVAEYEIDEDTKAVSWTDGGAAASGYVLKVKDKNGGVTQKGHLVEWALELDTSKITGKVGVDKLVKVYAADKTGTYSTIDAENTATSTGNDTVYSSKKLAERGLYWTTKDAAKTAVAAGNQTGAVEMFDRIIELQGTSEAEAGSGVYAYRAYGKVPQYQMDIVPYVQEVVTGLSSLKPTNKSVYTRTALGHYPVQSVVSNAASGTMNDTSSETITLKGFNLAGTKTEGENTSITVAVTNGTSVALSGDDITFTPASLQTSTETTKEGLKTSNFTVTVSGIPLMNNLNKNNASGNSGVTITDSDSDYDKLNDYGYNRMPNGDNNNKLTDDIWFDVWEINDRIAVPSNRTLGGTTMQVNSENGLIQYAFSDGLYFTMGNTPSTGNGSADATSSTWWAKGWDTIQEPSVGFHVDASGQTVGAGHPSDTASGDVVDNFALMTSRWGFSFAGASYGFMQYITNMRILEATGQYVNSKFVIHRQKIQSPSFASTKTTNSVNLYMAYYDALNKEIRFRAGLVPANDGTITLSDDAKKWVSSDYPDKKVTSSTSSAFDMYDDDATSGTNTAVGVQNYSARRSQVVADAYTDSNLNMKNSRGSGPYVSLAVSQDSTSKNDVVSMVWLDSNSATPGLKYSYKDNPMAYAKDDSTTKHQNNYNGAGWTGLKTIFSNYGGGDYCKVVADANGGIHIAAYAGNGYLYYAYAKDYNSDFIECCVDATDGVGQHLTMDVALEATTGNPIPYIGYYSTSGKPKHAYITSSTAATIKAAANWTALNKNKGIWGVDDNNCYTGNWEVEVVPTKNGLWLKTEDKINVGVWKYTDTDADESHKVGEIKASTSGTSTYGSKSFTLPYNGGTTTQTKNYSETYGNTTANPVLVYQTVDKTGNKNNVLESAQKR